MTCTGIQWRKGLFVNRQRKRKFACNTTVLATRILVVSNNLANAR